jgi:NAD(P)-dependent dehydrogenase (short-subunit alcohol dehydrogenase family)
MRDFEGKVAVITGAASGIGRELANVAAGLGMKLVLADVQVHPLERASAELQAEGASVLAMVCDVRKGRLVQELADAAVARFGAVHLVFNNAGVSAGGLVWESSEADWEWVLGVNLWGAIHGVRIFTRLMLARAAREPGYRGHIVNTASMAGLVNPPAMGVYNVSKHAVVALSESLYHDLRLVDAPIGVSVLCPYVVPTAIVHAHRQRPEDVKAVDEPTASQLAAQAMREQAVAAGTVSALDVARLAFEAVREERFYIYSHPQAMDGVAERMEAIVHQQLPPDPYRATPKLRVLLRSML